MKQIDSHSWRLIAGCVLAAGLGLAMPAAAQTVTGQARAFQTKVVGPLGVIVTTALADTGALSGPTDARLAGADAGNILTLVAGETLHATTIGWSDQVRSEASVSGLSINVGVVSVGADLVMARASAIQGLDPGATVDIDGLVINGTPVTVTGSANQTITFPGGRVVINERPATASGMIVNALHIAVTGVADVFVASATAGIQ